MCHINSNSFYLKSFSISENISKMYLESPMKNYFIFPSINHSLFDVDIWKSRNITYSGSVFIYSYDFQWKYFQSTWHLLRYVHKNG